MSYDFRNFVSDRDNPDYDDPFIDLTVDSAFYDMESFVNKFSKSDKPILLNLNAQSMMSKYDKLKEFVVNLTKINIQIDIIALQETWQIRYPDIITIPGFQKLIYSIKIGTLGKEVVWVSILEKG